MRVYFRSSEMQYAFANLYRTSTRNYQPTAYPVNTLYSTLVRVGSSQPLPQIIGRVGTTTSTTSSPLSRLPVFSPRTYYGARRSLRCSRSQVDFNPTSGRKFTKSIVVIPDENNMVPRGVKKQELHSRGLVVNFVDFWTGYSEEDVRWTIEASLSGIIDVTKPQPR